MINIADAETHECLRMRLLGAILRSVWVCATSPVGCPLKCLICERMFPHKPSCGSFICLLQTVAPRCPIRCLRWLEWKTSCQTYYIFGCQWKACCPKCALFWIGLFLRQIHLIYRRTAFNQILQLIMQISCEVCSPSLSLYMRHIPCL